MVHVSPMIIRINWPWDAPEKIEGIAVVFDVYAATTNIASLVYRKTRDLIIAGEKNVLRARELYRDALLIGETENSVIGGMLDSRNMPADVACLVVTGKRVILMTNNGTRVIEQALQAGARMVLTASFANIGSTARYLSRLKNETVLFIPAGERTLPDMMPDFKAMEDYYCAEALQDILTNNMMNTGTYIMQNTRSFIQTHYPPSQQTTQDIDIALSIDTCPLVVCCTVEEDGFIHSRALPI
jgi:phosphosulfolactate phosphohydrolase-like enzyme